MLWPHSKKVACLKLGQGLSVRGLNVLHVWISCRYSGFLSQSKTTHVMAADNYALALKETVCVKNCLSPSVKFALSRPSLPHRPLKIGTTSASLCTG